MTLQLNSDDPRGFCGFCLGAGEGWEVQIVEFTKIYYNNLSTFLRIIGSSKCFSAPVSRIRKASADLLEKQTHNQTEFFQASPKQSCYSTRISVLIGLFH